MDHDYIEAHDVSSRYVTGRLPDGEERDFEAHLVDCQRCIDAVEAEMSLRDGLRTVGSESAPQPFVRVVPPTSKATTAYRLVQAAAAVLLAVSVGLGAWLSRSRVELGAARGARAELERRAEQAEQSARTLEKRLAEVSAPANAAPTIARTEPVVPAAVFALTTVRGSSAGANPVNRIRIDGNPKVVVFSLEIPTVPGAGDCEVSLKDRAGRLLWSGTLTSSPSDALGVAVDRALLPAGDYVLEVSRRSAGRSQVLGLYPFRVDAG